MTVGLKKDVRKTERKKMEDKIKAGIQKKGRKAGAKREKHYLFLPTSKSPPPEKKKCRKCEEGRKRKKREIEN